MMFVSFLQQDKPPSTASYPCLLPPTQNSSNLSATDAASVSLLTRPQTSRSKHIQQDISVSVSLARASVPKQRPHREQAPPKQLPDEQKSRRVVSMSSSSKGKGKAKAPAGSSKQDVASKPGGASTNSDPDANIVADFNDDELWPPEPPEDQNLLEEDNYLNDNMVGITHISNCRDFDAEYNHYAEAWDKARCTALLEHTFGEIKESCDLKQCINLGLGKFATKILFPVRGITLPGAKKPCGPNDVVRRLNPTLNQFIFFRQLVKFLGIPDANVYFQAPGFTTFERSFLKSCFHEGCILNPHEGEPRPSGAQKKLTPETFLMAPMVPGALAEVLQPADKVPGLYLGTQMMDMILAKYRDLTQTEIRAQDSSLLNHTRKSIGELIPRFVDQFRRPDQCEIRTLIPESVQEQQCRRRW